MGIDWKIDQGPPIKVRKMGVRFVFIQVGHELGSELLFWDLLSIQLDGKMSGQCPRRTFPPRVK